MKQKTSQLFQSSADVIARLAPDVPCFVFSKSQLIQDCDMFLNNFNGTLSYAIKANPAPYILDCLNQKGVNNFDVASPNEIAALAHISPHAASHYNNPIRSDYEIAAALNYPGVRSFCIDHEDGLRKLADHIAPQRRSDYDVMVRFKGEKSRKAYDFGSKFGAAPRRATQLLKQAHQLGFGTCLGFHVGSQCEETYAFDRHIRTAEKISTSSNIPVLTLNVGGGFPSPYASAACPPLEHYFTTLHQACKSYFGANAPRLMAEPGRALVAGCTNLLARVRHRRGDNRLYINDGVYGGLMEIKFMPIMPPTKVWRGTQTLKGNVRPFTLFGPTCDSYDVLPRPFMLPETIKDGDWIEFALMGAYAQASLTRFNGLGDHQQYDVISVAL